MSNLFNLNRVADFVGCPPDVIERQLAHKEKNKVRASYNQAEYLEERRAMMQQWADYVTAVHNNVSVVVFGSPTAESHGARRERTGRSYGRCTE
jgi:hypothetical protein